MDGSSTPQLDDEPSPLRNETNAHGMGTFGVVDSEQQSPNGSDTSHQIPLEVASLRKPFSQPPPEVLHLIFERTIPPYFMLDPLASFRLVFRQVLRQKKALVTVCRTWYSVAVPFLYENVSVHHVPQLPKLIQTLIDSPQSLKLKGIIRTVDVHCHVPEGYDHHFRRQLQLLFSLCPRITSCNFRSQLPPTTSLWAAVSSITHFSLHEGITLSILEEALQFVSSRIIFLSFHVPEPEPNSTSPTISDKRFPHLQDLSIWFSSRAAPTLDVLFQLWNVPRLSRLTFYVRVPGMDGFPIQTLEKFCKFYGGGLRYLHIMVPWITIRPVDHDIQCLMKFCPALEHIVISPRCSLPLKHERIKWVDIWSPTSADLVEVEDLRSKIKPNTLPALKGVRFLPFYLRDKHSYNLPLLIPPDLVSTPADAFECRFLEVGISHDVGEIRYIQPEWLVEDMDEDDSDAEYSQDELMDEYISDAEYSIDESQSEDESSCSGSDDDDGGHNDNNEETGSNFSGDGLETDFPWLGNISPNAT